MYPLVRAVCFTEISRSGWSPPHVWSFNIRQMCHSEALGSGEPALTCVTTATALECVYWKQLHHHAATMCDSESDRGQRCTPCRVPVQSDPMLR